MLIFFNDLFFGRSFQTGDDLNDCVRRGFYFSSDNNLTASLVHLPSEMEPNTTIVMFVITYINFARGVQILFNRYRTANVFVRWKGENFDQWVKFSGVVIS